MKNNIVILKKIGIVLSIVLMSITSAYSQALWNMAKKNIEVLTLAVWFTAQDVGDLLSSPAGLDKAVSWCKEHGVTKVYLEAYGRGLYAKRNTLEKAKQRFLNEGCEVASGATTAGGPDNFIHYHCYTNKAKQEELQKIIEYTASIFDEIILDDWFFTNCQCDECITARGNQSWAKYYTDLMVKMSRERVVNPAHAVNPNVKVIIKFPQWNDEFHMRGYDVVREPKIFDGIWVGTEDREFDYGNSTGYETPYNAYFNMRWLATLGSVGGGWFDTGRERTKVNTYLEQARHTVLGEGKEMILWCYSNHLPAVAKTDALSKELPGLIKLAKIVQGKTIKGVHLLKPGNSDPFEEEWVCSFMGSLGIPFVPASEIDERATSAVFPVQVLKDPGFVVKLQRMIDKGTPIVVTDGLANRLITHTDLLKKLTVLPVNGSPKTLLKMGREEIKPFRDKLLAPFGIKFDAPNKVELYLFGDNTFAIENINDEAVDVTLELPKVSKVSKALVLPEEGGDAELSLSGNKVKIRISPRALAVVDYN
ncbi:MAG TPA: hypothetical protein VFC65_10125 [Prolixibacteraceae bacterium]|nr:hypothetical protein [Prolixibacteraceae bacterium]